MEKIVKIFREHNGYARTRELKSAGIHTREIASALREGLIQKIKRGLYKLVNYPRDNYSSFLDVCRANKAAVICLNSALAYHHLTTFNPSIVTVAVPHNTDLFKITYPPTKVFFFPGVLYSLGSEKVETRDGDFVVYNREKTLCDMFRYRKKLGEDLALEGLKHYLRLKQANVNKLKRYAEICQVKTVMMPYLKAILG
jgi:predicted transcriptional regulator of viral defense system